MLAVNRLRVAVGDKQILTGINLRVRPGELVAVMGPNGSGKSTLAYALAGHPAYTITGGKISLDGRNLNRLSPDRRAKAGLFLGFQYPVAVAGVDLFNLLRQAYICLRGKNMAPFEFKALVEKKLKSLALPDSFLDRSINDGFSGGEKKKSEILQLAVLRPKYAVLDEIDSGLDIDAVRTVARAINRVKQDHPGMGLVLITHYRRILDYLPVDRVVIIKSGRVAEEGGAGLVRRLEKHGYGRI